MAALDNAPSTRGPIGVLMSFGGVLRALVTKIVAQREDARTRRLLASLNERELNDIGLTRFDVERLTRPGQPR